MAVDDALRINSESSEASLEAALNVIKLAASMVRQIAWERLPSREVSRNIDFLKWYERRIGAYIKNWDDAKYLATLRKIMRLNAGLSRTTK